MPELGTLGSVRGVASNGHPYRDKEVTLRRPRRSELVEGNMCGIAMRDAVAPPGSKAPSRPKGTRRNLRGLMSDHRLQSRLARIGKVRNRSR